MELSVIKKKRKVSCLYCRSKKLKCDGKLPCARCIKKDSSDKCAYGEQRPLGRPPKNAVVNKLTLNQTKQFTQHLYNDFIIENVTYTIPNSTRFIRSDKTRTLHYFLDSHFSQAIGIAVNELAIVRYNNNPCLVVDVKIYDILDIHTWTAVEFVNRFCSKISSISIEGAFDYEHTVAALFQDLAFKFLIEPPSTPPLTNPLLTLSTQQAIRLIELFFTAHPCSHFLNKTLLLQAFWTDAVDPLLLCVIYGTAIYFGKTMEGKPIGIRDAVDGTVRNVFLDYAYYLLQKSSDEPNVAKYQAVSLLCRFEGTHGYPKRGMSMLGLAHMMESKLGLTDGSLLSTEISDVEAELMINVYWANFIVMVYLCTEVGHPAKFTNNILPPPLPPTSIQKSLSYQLDISNGNQRHYQSYQHLVETFYVAAVTSKFINELLLEFPEVKYNVLYPRYDKEPKPPVGLPTVDDLVPRLMTVLQEFNVFIQETRHTWSTRQIYTIESMWMLLDIHLLFINDYEAAQEGTSYANSIFDIFRETKLSINDPSTMARVQMAIPRIYRLIDTTQAFLSNDNNPIAFLPRHHIISVLETSSILLCLKHSINQQDDLTLDYLKKVSSVIQSNIWTNWTAITILQQKVDFYLNQFNGMNGRQQQLSMDDSSNGLLDSSILSNLFDSSLFPSESTLDDDLAWASFFDPCSEWLNPMTNSLPVNRTLCDNTIQDINNFTSTNDMINPFTFSPTITTTTTSSSSLSIDNIPNTFATPTVQSQHTTVNTANSQSVSTLQVNQIHPSSATASTLESSCRYPI